MGQEKVSIRDNPALRATRAALARDEVPDWVKAHLEEYLENPAQAQWWDGSRFGGFENTPTLLLTTRGRKSGRTNTMPLIYGRDDGRYILVGSKGGMDRHPAWFLNLRADPDVAIQVGEVHIKARASVAEPGERERLYAMMETVFPPYTAYQEKTERTIPIAILEPVED